MIVLALVIAFMIAWPLLTASEKRGDSDAWDHPQDGQANPYEGWK
jgi:hypothetical protein